jgi:hypothetical protein
MSRGVVAMQTLNVLLTSAVVSAVVAGIFKWFSDVDQSRRGFLSGVLTESYKREAAAYELLWKEMFALQQSSSNFLTTYEMSIDGISFDVTKEKVKEAGRELVSANAKLIGVMDQNRPFFHRDVYDALLSFSKYTRSEQWMRFTYPALHNIEGTFAGIKSEPFDYEKALRDMEGRIDEVSRQMRVRMTAPEETFSASWMPLRNMNYGDSAEGGFKPKA